MATENFISIGAASKLYNVSKRTIERLIKNGDLPYHRIGKQIRLSPYDLRRATGRETSALATAGVVTRVVPKLIVRETAATTDSPAAEFR